MFRRSSSALAPLAGVALALCAAAPALAVDLPVEEFTLDNGMTFLLVPRTEQPNVVSAGWVAHVGSVNERPGITGISHFFEHMMFKGTRTIGTSDPDKDAQFRADQERVRSQLRDLQIERNYARWKAGEIDDPWDPAHDDEDMATLRAELDQLVADHKSVIVKDEFDQVYTAAGADRMNAFTSYDLTFYFITVPANKMELWAWMESDRLADSVFREFYSERDVVHEERRLRVESTPTGVYEEQFDAMFWGSSPYSWSVIGWPTDLNAYTMAQAQEYFDVYYRPNNLTGVIVGDFDPAEVKPLVTRYFGRLEQGAEPPPVVTLEVPQLATKRMNATCDCQPQVQLAWQGPAFGNRDAFVLDVLTSVLSGRTGRLHKAMIEGEEIASSAYAYIDARRLGGAVVAAAETKGEATPEQLEAAILAEIERLKTEPVPDEELQKVKNRALADSYRKLQDNYGLMVQLGYYEALGGWEWLEKEADIVQEVTAEDLLRVANEVFVPEHLSVATYERDGEAVVDPELDAVLAKIPSEAHGMIRQQLKQIESIEKADALSKALEGMAAQAANVPAELKPAFEFLQQRATARLDALQQGGE